MHIDRYTEVHVNSREWQTFMEFLLNVRPYTETLTLSATSAAQKLEAGLFTSV